MGDFYSVWLNGDAQLTNLAACAPDVVCGCYPPRR